MLLYAFITEPTMLKINYGFELATRRVQRGQDGGLYLPQVGDEPVRQIARVEAANVGDDEGCEGERRRWLDEVSAKSSNQDQSNPSTAQV